MAIKTVGGFQKVLSEYNTKKWSDSADLKAQENMTLKQAPGIKVENTETQKSFGDFLASSINKVNELQLNANTAIEKLATGESKNLHETMLAVEQADIAFKTMNQVRMKVIDAYREVMKMQV